MPRATLHVQLAVCTAELDLRALQPLTPVCISPSGFPIMSSSRQPTLPWPLTGLPLRQVRIRRAALHAVSESPTPMLYGIIALECVVGGYARWVGAQGIGRE
jgi:hypothetical protein